MPRTALMRGAFFALLANFAVAGAPVQSGQPITPRDLVREAIVRNSGQGSADGIGVRSPDGMRVALVIERGDPDTLANSGELFVVTLAETVEAVGVERILQLQSESRYAPIGSVRWMPDGKSLLFLGAQDRSSPQVYRVDLETRKLDRISESRSAVAWFDLTPDASRLVTVDERAPLAPSDDPTCLREGCRVTSDTVYGADRGWLTHSYPLSVHDLTGARTVRPVAEPEASHDDLQACHDELEGGISPNGRYGIRYCRVQAHRWPEWWADYTLVPELRTLLASGSSSFTRRLMLIDLASGASRPLLKAPYIAGNIGTAPPVWIDGGQHVLLPGAVESLEQVSGTARATRADRYAVQLIDTATLEARTVGVLPRDARRIDSATWDATKQRLIIRSADSSRKELPTLVLQRNGTRWRILPRATADGAKVANARVQLELQQDLNQSPVLIARDAKSGARRTLLELNPWLGQHTLSRVEEISWVSKDGRTWKGGLYYPLGYLPDRRYPLMLQTHGFQPGKFALSGITANFNAQALAARGIAVLQVDDDGIGVTGEGEWPAAQAIYEGAIDALDARGLIDRQRVGLQGWSRTGGYVGYTLTHSSYPFAAAALTDSADFGWWYYLSVGGTHGESAYGVKPYGAGFDVWRRMSATFNLDRVRTPMFMWQAGSPVNLWDWYAVLKRLGKPVEYWYLPDGAHVPYKVGERVHMSELLVDWFDFWLNDHEVATPEKAEQYARWRKWREQEG